jgi:serine kinase of HPr protein (carbohydrate metabolism regulator)
MIGRSGCGKTKLVMNLILRGGFLDYNMLKLLANLCSRMNINLLKKLFRVEYLNSTLFN